MKRRKIDPSNASLLEVVYAQTGSLRKTAKVIAYIEAWGVARRELGHAPTTDEYAEYWRQNVRSAYRELSAFREAFPHLHDPGPVVDVLDQARQDDRLDFRTVAA